ncbi:large proline-rich protein BAG6 isoform X2 [Coccinella septempunctata]|uniref:large proline-rich protein BAG6 isoform X2 n=1 Tax=Coccinella septempunctata TaxID=41139 RepID=UPI001D0927DB|nr:large proline-rich protein BAG6 isoform X2 [Coccinella septempunctata]
MINLTVKTLDSRNHQFSVNDDMTVEEFKRHIAEEVNISAETQRIIYCGRVLQDSSKLIDHDLDGKAVHLVQRPPPGTTPSNSSRSSRTSSPHPTHRMFPTFETNNATVFLGSVYPSNLDTQGVLHPPTHTHAFTRLNVARRMLRRAEHLITQLENPTAPSEPAPQDDPQDEVLPIIEARLYYPGAHTAADESQIITQFFQNYLRRESQNSGNASQSSGSTPQVPTNTNTGEQSTPNTSTSTAPPNESVQDTRFPENATRTAQLAEVLRTLNDVQLRFAPFLERYQNFMRNDPVVTSNEETQKIQLELNKVSEVMHFLSHAYHSLSDVILRVRTSPPRPLLTRPLMLQQSAFVQTRMGIPIQVEAQINLSERPSGGASNGQAPQTGETAPPNTTAPTATPQSFSSQAVPMISTVRVPIPLEIRGLMPTQGMSSFVPAREGGGAASGPAAAAAAALAASGVGIRSNSASTSTSFSSSDPEVELIMEVTPEVLRGGSINGQQPANFIHTMMQMATELIHGTGRDPTAARQTSATSAPPLTPTPPAQNSQARGNNQTNPTSSTQTRSTPRPHVHLHHQNIPSGFDPYLPCHSHHVSRRRVFNESSSTSASAAQNQSSSETPTARVRVEERQNLSSDTLHGRLHGAVNRLLEQVGIGDAPTAVGEDRILPSLAEAMIHPSAFSGSRVLERRYTLESVFGEFNLSGTYRSGESIFGDVCMALYRTLSLRDILRLNVGDYTPLARVMTHLREYFSSLSLESGARINEVVERFVVESQGVFLTMSQVPIWRDVDITATLIKFFRAKLPAILGLCARELERDTSDPTALFETVVTTVKELGALVFRACNRDVDAAELVFNRIRSKHLKGLPEELLAWFAPNGYSFLTDFLRRNSHLIGSVESYIVLQKPASQSEAQECFRDLINNQEEEEEPMEVEEAQPESASDNEPSTLPKPKETVTEPLPNVVHGSQPWHSQVPADWVPIITRDVQQQKKSNIQAPFSDAYLSGMPSKRRKIVHNNKLKHGIPLPQVIAESVRKAVNNTGLAAVAPLETVSRHAGTSVEIQNAYRALLRTSVQQGLRDNPDFTPERFPNAANYFFPK